jgi:hypothetical protein
MLMSCGGVSGRQAQYQSPITESFRRKVVQYVAWADGEPSRGYDHGTWCSSSAVGKCVNETSSANQFNGIASSAKVR